MREENKRFITKGQKDDEETNTPKYKARNEEKGI